MMNIERNNTAPRPIISQIAYIAPYVIEKGHKRHSCTEFIFYALFCKYPIGPKNVPITAAMAI